MRTSQTQFDMMVTYMEQHGDLSKPTTSARGRIETIQCWDELTQLLNSDGSGDSKSMEKWKKVWSDLKNNTKRKAARIHRAATGTGGGPALGAKLSELEERVLNLIGMQAATGLVAVAEAGLSQHDEIIAEAPTPHLEVEVEADDEVSQISIHEEEWNRPGTSQEPHVPPPHVTPPPAPTTQPAISGQTPVRPHITRRIRSSPRRHRRSQTTGFQEASQNFVHSDEEWRKFLIQAHQDKDRNEKERLRLREIELQLQRQWQEIFHRMLDALNKIIEKNN